MDIYYFRFDSVIGYTQYGTETRVLCAVLYPKGKVEGPLVVLKTYVKTAYSVTDKEYEGISNIFILFKIYTNLAINI